EMGLHPEGRPILTTGGGRGRDEPFYPEADRSTEYRKFLIRIDKEVPAELDVHIICDNYATHKTDLIQRWLAAHPRFHVHFVPTISSWLNVVERWFGELTTKLIQRGVHKSVQALEADIRAWIEPGTRTPVPTYGPRPPTPSSTASPHIANESQALDTRTGLLLVVCGGRWSTFNGVETVWQGILQGDN